MSESEKGTKTGAGKTRMIHFRVTPAEADALADLAVRFGVKRSRLLRVFLREGVREAPEYLPQGELAMRALVNEVGAVGRNLNQLVRTINTAASEHTASGALAEASRLEAVRSEVEAVREVLRDVARHLLTERRAAQRRTLERGHLVPVGAGFEGEAQA